MANKSSVSWQPAGNPLVSLDRPSPLGRARPDAPAPPRTGDARGTHHPRWRECCLGDEPAHHVTDRHHSPPQPSGSRRSHSTPDSSESGDEIARLGDAFRRMSTRVRDSLLSAEAARTEAVATADQLQTRTSELEQQTRQARALAEELEEQFEEAQSLSEELDQSNARAPTDRPLEADTARRALGDIVESITDAFVVYDRDWRMTFINQRRNRAVPPARCRRPPSRGKSSGICSLSFAGRLLEHRDAASDARQ